MSRTKNSKYESMSLEELKANMEKSRIFWSREKSWWSERNVLTD